MRQTRYERALESLTASQGHGKPMGFACISRATALALILFSTGRSYHADIPPESMTIAQFVRYLDEVVDLVRRRRGSSIGGRGVHPDLRQYLA